MQPMLNGLNRRQCDAVTSTADILQVLAPPGSGKTKTLTARVAYHIDHDGIQPEDVIVCTFTIKAAREMEERIRSFVGQQLQKKLILGTFHSVARRYLVSYGYSIGIPQNFGIADSSDSLAIIKRIIKAHKLGIEAKVARTRISGLKARCISCNDYNSSTKRANEHEFAMVYRAYELALKQANLLDYDDLLLRCVDLLRQHPECVSNVEAVLIDEFQDTNVVQFELMCLFSQRRKKVTIVGDPDQSIYGFRCAEIANLQRMRDHYPDFQLINLEQNYRSAGAILATAQRLIDQDTNRPSKSLQATHTTGDFPVFRKVPSAAAEAAWIVAEIKRLRSVTGKLLGFNDFAILLRSASLSRHIETSFGKEGIPYRMVGGHRFFDRVEVKTLLDYLRVVHQPCHNDALKRIVNVPARKVGDATVDALLEEGSANGLCLWDVILQAAQGIRKPKTKLTGPTQKGLEIFVNIILMLRRLWDTRSEPGRDYSLRDLMESLLKKLSYKEYLRRTYPEELETRWANIEELLAQATDIGMAIDVGEGQFDEPLPDIEGVTQRQTSSTDDALTFFLANVALSTEIEKNEEQSVTEQVTISTIHAAKGLEWPIVFIPAAYEGSIPHSRAEDTDEERRLLYVGMTRAKALLYLSCPVKNSNSEQTTQSHFLADPLMKKLLRLQGPILDYRAIQDITCILGRELPTPEELDASWHAADQKEDDYWPLDGGYPQGLSGDQLSACAGLGAYPNAKRRKLDTSTLGGFSSVATIVSASTTMQAQSGFSISTTTLQSGFVGAEMQRRKPQQQASSRQSAVGPVEVGNYSKPTAKEKPRKKQRADQSSLITFFGAAGCQVESNTSTPAPEPPQTTVLPSKNHPSQLHLALQDIKNLPTASPSSQIPNLLIKRKPCSAPMHGRPRTSTSINQDDYTPSSHIFLSSSPTRPEPHDVPNTKLESGPPSPGQAAAAQTSSSRPATTLHTTSIQTAGRVNTGRKTLGMRRSVQSGWPPPKRNC
jgi:DNA helicase II / ATP-dependent DNA helicase PcrA